MSLYLQNLAEHRAVFDRLEMLDEPIRRAGDMLTRALLGGGKLMFCGNGGSAADSQHLASEFTGRFIADRRPIAALALSTDSSALTCIGNDYDFEQIFVRQLQALGRPGDVVVGLSTSGNSGNVVRTFEAARASGIGTVGILGRDGGRLAPLSDVAVIVPADVTARIQEAHILIGHTLCGLVEQGLGLA